MKMELDSIVELLNDNRRMESDDRERVELAVRTNEAMEWMVDRLRRLEKENAQLREDLDDFGAQIERGNVLLEQAKAECEGLKEEKKALQMQLAELGKMTSKVAEQTEHGELVKVLRKYMNMSRRKTAKKRGYIKMVVTEMVIGIGLVLPEDMKADLDVFDDDEEKLQVQGDFVMKKEVR